MTATLPVELEAVAFEYPDEVAELHASYAGTVKGDIHEQGSLHETPDLITRATGRPLELQPFLDHLRARYLS